MMGWRWQQFKSWFRGKRGYDSASLGKQTDGWRGAGSSANAANDSALVPSRQNARETVRNSAEAASGVSVLVTNMVGDGLQPRSQASHGDEVLPPDEYGRPRETVNERADAIWQEWYVDAGSDGQLDAYGLQIQAARAVVESGEVFLRRRWRRASDGLPVPVQIELLEADFLDEGKTGHRPSSSKGEIVQGVELDGRGRRVAYWMYPRHPGAITGIAWEQSKRIKASEISHAFEPLRPGQVRGITFLSPILTRLMAFADYSEAELERKRLEASIFASVTGSEGAALGAFQADGSKEGQGPSKAVDAQGVPWEEIESGTVVYPPTGTSVDLHAPASVGGVAEYRRQELTAIASGMRLVYTLLTGDLSGTNYSSIRAGLIEVRRFIKQQRRLYFVRKACAPQWAWMIEAAQLIGRLPVATGAGMAITYRARWTPPAFESVDRLKDAQADALDLANSLASFGGVVLRRGDVPEDLLEDVAKWMGKLAELGIVPAWAAGQTPDIEPVEDDEEVEEDE